MSKRKRQVEHAMLESWRSPRGAGDPIGCLATTFTFDAGFFEEECLARFLEIDSLPDREGLAYLLERENRLGATYAGVLVDHRQAGVDHSLRWDVLPVRISRGKQHAKISLLAWTKHVRIVIASANLTPHGYRFNHEVAGTIELTPQDAAHTLLDECGKFLSALVGLVPGPVDDPTTARAVAFLDQVKRQVGTWSNPRQRGTHLDQHLVFTLPATQERAAQSSLTTCMSACRRYGTSPAEAWVASPFFDPAKDAKEDAATAELCKSMARGGKRHLTLCVPDLGDDKAGVRLAAPRSLFDTAKRLANSVSIASLPKIDNDKNARSWHAKMLALSAKKYNALMIGSSNFTKAGLGVGGVFNAEANLLYIARREAFAREAGAIDECWPKIKEIRNPESVEWTGPQSELVEEESAPAAPAIPAGFAAARYRAGDTATILFTLLPADLPPEWQILGGLKHAEIIVDSAHYQARDKPSSLEAAWPHSYAPGKLLVKWGDEQAFWAVNVEDQAKLPVPHEIETMTVQDLLYILAASDASAAFRAWARQRGTDSEFDDELDSAVPPDLDPLRRYNLQDTFLRRVRRQARLLAAVRHNLQRPVWSEQALQWRLSGMIGVQRLAERMAQGLCGESGQASEAVLSLADLLLMLGDVEYRESQTAMSRRDFNRFFKQFLTRLVADLDGRIDACGSQISSDVRQFWSRVRRRYLA
jgi:hypothetical protein